LAAGDNRKLEWEASIVVCIVCIIGASLGAFYFINRHCLERVQLNRTFRKKFQRLTRTIAEKFARYTLICSQCTWTFNSNTLRPIPAAQIKLNLANRTTRSNQALALATNPRKLQTSFQTKLLMIATSAAMTLLKLKFQPSMDGDASSQMMPMSTARPVPPTTQNREYRWRSGDSLMLIARLFGY